MNRWRAENERVIEGRFDYEAVVDVVDVTGDVAIEVPKAIAETFIAAHNAALEAQEQADLDERRRAYRSPRVPA